jgi:protein-arginine deiminase
VHSYPAPLVDIRADNNRNGTIDLDDPREDEAEETWDSKHGAIFLANIDDDLRVCPTNVPDLDLEKCNDAADDVINGDEDLLDLARLKTVPWKDVPKGARGTLEITNASRVRLFKRTPDGFVAFDPAEGFTDAEVAAGIELAIEGRDIVRDATAWNGYVDVTFGVTYEGTERPAFTTTDKLRMRIAPLLLQHHNSRADRVFASRIGGGTEFRNDISAAIAAAKLPTSLEALDVPESDQWTQDFFETGYMSMPSTGGQHVIRVAIRSANLYRSSSRAPLRAAGKIVFTKLRGPDVAGLQQYDERSNEDMDTLNSFGNTETIPPHTGWPLGRILRGSTPSFYPDKSLAKLFESQRIQEPLFFDTSWLMIGHADETISFVSAPKPGDRSFLVLANDARLAKKMFEDLSAAGQGAATVFVGKTYFDWDTDELVAADKTVDQILADTEVMAASQEAAAYIDSQLEVLARETGLTPEEIVPVPGLHWKIYGGSVAYQPGMVNALVLDGTHVAMADPHGPLIDGKDPFKAKVETTLKGVGVTVSWVEDWDNYHRNGGEVHCGSNVFRAIPDAKWWEVKR